ncbi:ATP-binding protein [uncultured Pseudokineococcus sp.]|uniref:ATP-binding protein n=1 Tax=uncultured Pseudokineococcus sp. TaxID=1642928 RepID=UPI0034537F1B
MRSPVNNPFNPGSDVVPRVWAGRTAQLVDWRAVLRPRLVHGLPERGRTILGEPGLGKSALVRRIAAEAAEAGDWVTPQIRVPSGSDPLKLVARALLVLAQDAGLASQREKRLADLLGRVESVAASGVSLSLRERTGPEPHVVLSELLVEIGQAAMARKVACLVHVDEVQNITDERALSQLLIALGDAMTHRTSFRAPGGLHIEQSLPIAVYLTGLPEFEDRAGAQKGATFARRFATTVLQAIDDDDLVLALQDFVIPGWEVPDEQGGMTAVRMTQDAVAVLVDLCRGEPFLFQLAGQQAWYAGEEAVITADQVRAGWRTAQREAAAHVERIIGRLPPRERELVEAMAQLPPADRTLTRIAERAGFPSASAAGPTSQRLDTVRGIIDRGKPYSFRHRAVEAFLTSDWPAVG